MVVEESLSIHFSYGCFEDSGIERLSRHVEPLAGNFTSECLKGVRGGFFQEDEADRSFVVEYDVCGNLLKDIALANARASSEAVNFLAPPPIGRGHTRPGPIKPNLNRLARSFCEAININDTIRAELFSAPDRCNNILSFTGCETVICIL